MLLRFPSSFLRESFAIRCCGFVACNNVFFSADGTSAFHDTQHCFFRVSFEIPSGIIRGIDVIWRWAMFGYKNGEK